MSCWQKVQLTQVAAGEAGRAAKTRSPVAAALPRQGIVKRDRARAQADHLQKGKRLAGDAIQAGLPGVEGATSVAGQRLLMNLGRGEDVELRLEPQRSVRRFIPWPARASPRCHGGLRSTAGPGSAMRDAP